MAAPATASPLRRLLLGLGRFFRLRAGLLPLGAFLRLPSLTFPFYLFPLSLGY